MKRAIAVVILALVFHTAASAQGASKQAAQSGTAQRLYDLCLKDVACRPFDRHPYKKGQQKAVTIVMMSKALAAVNAKQVETVLTRTGHEIERRNQLAQAKTLAADAREARIAEITKNMPPDPNNPAGLVECSVTIWKRIKSEEWWPVAGTAYWDEEVPGADDPAIVDWLEMPEIMIVERATMRALAAGWPGEFNKFVLSLFDGEGLPEENRERAWFLK